MPPTARAPPPPITFIAWTYSRTRSDSASPRTSREVVSHEVSATTRIKIASVRLTMATTTRAKNRTGIDSRASTMRIMTESRTPPKYPATAPHKTPMIVASAAAAMPTVSEICPADISRPRMS